MQLFSITICLASLCLCTLPCSAARARLRTKLPHKIDPKSDDISPLHSVEDVAEPVEDLEKRQKPPHVYAHEVDQTGSLLASDLNDLLNEKRDDMQNCVIVHLYAEPLMVGDAIKDVRMKLSRNEDEDDDEDDDDDDDDDDDEASVKKSKSSDSETATGTTTAADTTTATDTTTSIATASTTGSASANVTGNATGNATNNGTGNATELPPLFKQGAVWDDSPTSDDVPLAVSVFATLAGITGPVQVIPHGIMARWTSKKKVPIGGYLCSQSKGVPGAPVLHATPTPCVPTSLDASGSPLDPITDGYEVFIGTTRLRFDNKSAADTFCVDYATRIASDLSTNVWDASSLGEALPDKNPELTKFVSMTGSRPAPEGWTKGRKKILVVVMDWMRGDNTLKPYSKQAANPIPHYRNTIFPEVNRQFERMSYGQFGLDVTFVPEVIRYNRPRNRYSARKMPFPALYDGARESLRGQRGDYSFDSYDLVYVIAPQVRPTGTKGVAWVGMKGAMCNGCETISDNFKIMVAVHELGHNLGLMHASSSVLEYGNPFDWMGNYPDVTGLNYGASYEWSLGWIPDSALYTIRDADLRGLSTVVAITPYDAKKSSGSSVSGIRLSLSQNSRDLWISFRALPDQKHSGIFLTLQAKDEANSELLDAACHSPSQQDAHLRVGWYYMDPSHTFGVKVLEITEKLAKVQVFEVGPSEVSKLYGQDTFTDGKSKCPPTCQDADWLMSNYNCPNLEKSGYCRGGSLTMQGRKYSIGMDLCPQTCGNCKKVMKQTKSMKAGGCENRNIKINGKSCGQVARLGWCDYQTKSGSSVGMDLCPRSCGQCPKVVEPSRTNFNLPVPNRNVGFVAGDTMMNLVLASPAVAPAPAPIASPMASPAGSPFPGPAPASDDDDDDDDEQPCEDDPYWKDKDGDSCAEYAKVIEDGTWSRTKACNYDGAGGSDHCRKTCNTCLPSTATCADSTCITAFMKLNGRCEQCSDWTRYCKGDTATWFSAECPLTCGVCKPKAAPAKVKPNRTLTNNETCGDDKCITAWKTADKCPTCKELGESFCSEESFAKACRGTCKLCNTEGNGTCENVFSRYTCTRYKTYGWCTRNDMSEAVQRQCPESCGLCEKNTTNVTVKSGSGGHHGLAALVVSLAVLVLLL